ncbi:MAG: hypothetical protein ABII82_05070 [Verrucomicrobiota bacterium]
MKTKSTLLLALTAITAMTFAPQTALAGHREDKVALAIGGLIGGIIIGKNIERHRQPAHCPPPSRVIVVQPHHRNVPACPPPPPSGYWQETQTRAWVPARWVDTYDCGRRVRVWQQGHYTYQTSRVWVETRPSRYARR